ncbi:YihY/virulence factor BrkB family protein [Formosa sp. L2A11]|uniref:YihY/virulence factor BrkB family protein n=1 Tax=Formosa sp. L2A11 TaxID=2686363 RepID=UPI00131D6820|nr:YihY/virulence factor BrkB family protein [Formosa sp. L2A11]
MTKPIEDKLAKIPVVNLVVKFFKTIRLPGLEGLSIYDLLELYTIGLLKGALTSRASAIAFNFFMAIFPFLLFILILIPHIPIAGFKLEFLDFLESFLPPTTSDFFFKNIFENIDRSERGGLLSTVFLLSIFLMANGVNAVFSAFENSYHSELSRNVFRQYLYALGVSLILSFLVVVTVAVFGFVEIYILGRLFDTLSHRGVEVGDSSIVLVNISKYIFGIIMIYLSTATLYYFGTRQGRDSRFFSVGALLTTLLIACVSYFFGIYIEQFSKYNELYGSIGALLILMFYLWLNANIILLGYELNVSLRQLHKSC